MLFGPDLSNYQKQLSLEHAEALVAGGCSFAMIGRQARNTYAPIQREHLRRAGITKIGEYLISLGGVWPALFPETTFVAVDVEPGSEFITEADIDAAIGWVREQGRTPLIYSSNWAWRALGLAGLTKYGEQGIPLWNANYDGMTNGFELPAPFGGWTVCAIDQYTDSWQDRAEIPYPLDMNCCDESFWGQVATDGRTYEDGLRDGTARALDAMQQGLDAIRRAT